MTSTSDDTRADPAGSDLRHRRRELVRRQIIDAASRLSAEHGLTGWTLGQLGAAVGMRAPSLYVYFDSKDAIYDAMFEAGYRQLSAVLLRDDDAHLAPLERFRRGMQRFADFAQGDPVRYQLMFQRPIPGFEPSPTAYAASVESYEEMRESLADVGIVDQRHIDLWTALSAGILGQQLANDPGGTRFLALIDEALEMYLNHIGIEREE